MQRSVHFERMRETAKLVIPLIRDRYIAVTAQYPFMEDALDNMVQKRTQPNQCLLRPYLVRLSYELVAGNKKGINWTTIIPACAALEIFNISTYQSNSAFDSKNGIVSNIHKNNQFICSTISFGLAINLILELENTFGKEVIYTIVESIYKTNSDIYLGQFYDLNILNISNLDTSISEEDYMPMYLERCEKLGGSLTSFCLETGGLLGEADNELLNNLRNIGKMIGTAGQMVNDISDFIPHSGEENNIKGYQRTFSDLMNGKVTYPIFYLLKKGDKEQRRIILSILQGDRELDLDAMNLILHMLRKVGAIKRARDVITGYYKELKKEVRKLPKSEKRDLLSLSFSSLLNNKYFAILREYCINQNGYHTIKWKGSM